MCVCVRVLVLVVYGLIFFTVLAEFAYDQVSD